MELNNKIMSTPIKKILISQPKPTDPKSPYYEIAEQFGVELVFRPFIKVECSSSRDFRQQRISVTDYMAVIFTSRTAIDCFFKLCEEMRITVPVTMRYFCSTEQIAVYLHKYIVYRKRKVFFGAGSRPEDIMAVIAKYPKEKYLLPVSSVHKEDLPLLLNEKKINYTKAVMYHTVSNDFTPDEVFDYDMLIFFSPTGVKSLMKNFPDFEQGNLCIGTLGAKTAMAVRDAGLRLDLEAPTPKQPSMSGALREFLKSAMPSKA